MNIIEFIGYIIVLVALVFLNVRRARQVRHMEEHPEEHEADLREKDRQMRRILGLPDIQYPEMKPKVKIPEKLKIKQQPLPPQLPKEKPKEVFVPDHAYREKVYEESRGSKLIGDLKSVKQMVIYREIFGPPKALEKDDPFSKL